jgi:ABC-type spermidine/putrescine transport system permease subunit II
MTLNNIKRLKIKSICLLYFMVLPIFMISTVSCSSNKGHTLKKKKLKRGRPIPCPVKDC